MDTGDEVSNGQIKRTARDKREDSKRQTGGQQGTNGRTARDKREDSKGQMDEVITQGTNIGGSKGPISRTAKDKEMRIANYK